MIYTVKSLTHIQRPFKTKRRPLVSICLRRSNLHLVSQMEKVS